jgi:hypothetical protein
MPRPSGTTTIGPIVIAIEGDAITISRRDSPILGALALGAMGAPVSALVIFLGSGQWRFASLVVPVLFGAFGWALGRSATSVAFVGTRGSAGTLRWRNGDAWESAAIATLEGFVVDAWDVRSIGPNFTTVHVPAARIDGRTQRILGSVNAGSAGSEAICAILSEHLLDGGSADETIATLRRRDQIVLIVIAVLAAVCGGILFATLR